jgi:citrate synthase
VVVHGEPPGVTLASVPHVDQRSIDNQPIDADADSRDFWDSRRAAAYLGIKARSLYAYASRGLVQRLRRGKKSLYARADLERLKARHDARSGHGPVAAHALQWGEPVLATRISSVTGDGPCYRGQPAVELVRQGRSFEDVCALLWGEGPPAAGQPRSWPRPPIAPSPPRGTHPRPRAASILLRLLDVAVERLAHDPAPFGLAPERERDRARSLVQALAIAAATRAPSRVVLGDPAALLLHALGGPSSPAALALVNATLVLCADHELNASTFAARIAASTGADLHACVVAALATFLGPRHGAASTEVEAFLADAPTPARAVALVRDHSARGRRLPGFGHPLYPHGDPRATTLLALVGKGSSAPGMRTLMAVAREAQALRGDHPNIDFALVAVSLHLRLPPGSAQALFAVGRSAGWIAHALEQRTSDTVLRPRALYIGV